MADTQPAAAATPAAPKTKATKVDAHTASSRRPAPRGRLYAKAVFSGYKRGLRNQHEGQAILKVSHIGTHLVTLLYAKHTRHNFKMKGFINDINGKFRCCCSRLTDAARRTMVNSMLANGAFMYSKPQHGNRCHKSQM